MTFTIRGLRVDDGPAVRRVLTEAFNDGDRVAALAEALRSRPDRGVALVAVDERDDVVGCVQLSMSWVDAPDRLVEVLVLSPLGVASSHRSNGIGTALLAAARAAAVELGAPLLFLEGDPAFYSTRGWRAATEFGCTAPSARIPGPAFQVVTLPGYDPASMRGALVYNDTFWSHDCVGLRQPGAGTAAGTG